jgi:hypothetical protein
VVSRFVRKVRAASGAVAVQVVTRRGRQVERLSPGQGVLDLGDLPVVPARMDEVADWTGEPELPLQPAVPTAVGRPVAVAAGGPVVGTSADLLWAVLTGAYARLGFDVLGDDGFRAMALARIVEPASKAEVVRVLDEIAASAVSLRTLFRSLARSQARDYRGQLPPHGPRGHPPSPARTRRRTRQRQNHHAPKHHQDHLPPGWHAKTPTRNHPVDRG